MREDRYCSCRKKYHNPHEEFWNNPTKCHNSNSHHHSNCKSSCKKDRLCRDCLCSNQFRIRLGGLTTNLNFRLRQLIGCKVKLNVESSNGSNWVLAKLCYVGDNFIEVKKTFYINEVDDQYVPKDIDEVGKGGNSSQQYETDYEHAYSRGKKQFTIYPLDVVKSFELHEKCNCRSLCNGNCNCK